MNTVKSVRFGEDDDVVVEMVDPDGKPYATISTTVGYLQQPAEKHDTKAAEYSEKHDCDIWAAIEEARPELAAAKPAGKKRRK
jgi:hypothetical protein